MEIQKAFSLSETSQKIDALRNWLDPVVQGVYYLALLSLVGMTVFTFMTDAGSNKWKKYGTGIIIITVVYFGYEILVEDLKDTLN